MAHGDSAAGHSGLGPMLRQAREAKGRSLRQVAERCGIGRSTLSRWEHDEVSPCRSELQVVLEAIGLDDQERTRFLSSMDAGTWSQEAEVRSRRRLFRAARLRNDLSLGVAANLIGVTKATLSRWETGDRWPGRTRLADAAEVVGASRDEIDAIRSEGPLLDVDECSPEELHTYIRSLRKSIPWSNSATRDVEFIGLDAKLATRNGESRRLRLELRTAYVEWLGWWYRDAEAVSVAQRLLPALRRDPTSPVWGRILRACSNYTNEQKRDPDAAMELLSEALGLLKGTPSEGFVRRELAGLYWGQGATDEARDMLDQAREAGAGEESSDVHLYCCSMIEAVCWSSNGQHDRAVASLPTWDVDDPYLRSASAVGRANIFKLAGYRDRALIQLEEAANEALAQGLDHFARGLTRRLTAEIA